MTHRDRSRDPDQLDEALNEAAVHAEWRQSTRPSTSIVKAVATATGLEPTELPPLHEYVETDALDSLVTAPKATEQPVRVSFPYDRLEVTVDGDGDIEIRPAES